MKKILFFFVLVSYFLMGKSQNLVPNGSFEETIYPLKDDSSNPVYEYENKRYVLYHWKTLRHNATVNCNLQLRNPLNISPRTGKNVVGMTAFLRFGKARNYVYVSLIKPLEAGKKYYAEMYVAYQASISSYTVNKLGMYFYSDTSFYAVDYKERDISHLKLNPQVFAEQIITDSSNWVKISGEFIAQENSKYLILGVFHDINNLKYKKMNSGDGTAEYFIDDVLVQATDCISISENQTICEGEKARLEISTYQNEFLGWASDDNPTEIFSKKYEIQVFPKSTTTYLAYSQCDTLSVIVYVNKSPKVDLGKDTILCHQEKIQLDVKNPFASYLWQDSTQNAFYEITKKGLYWVEVTQNECKKRDSVFVDYYETEVAKWKEDTSFCLEETDFYIIDAFTPNATYLWQDASQKATFLATESGKYWVEVKDSVCHFRDTIDVKFQKCVVKIEMPNVFTPNNDDKNEYFLPIVFEGIAQANLQIYNRWGKMIFETNEIAKGWNGRNCVDGVYYWSIEYEGIKGEKGEKKGYVMLIR